MLGVPTISPSKPARKKPKLLAPKSARRDGKFTKIRGSKPSLPAPIEPEPARELARRAAEARRAYFGETSKPICPLNEYNLDDNGFDDNFGNDWSQYDQDNNSSADEGETVDESDNEDIEGQLFENAEDAVGKLIDGADNPSQRTHARNKKNRGAHWDSFITVLIRLLTDTSFPTRQACECNRVEVLPVIGFTGTVILLFYR